MTDTKLYFWRARTLYLGPALGLSPHRNAVAVVCAGLNGHFRVAVDPRARKPNYIRCRVALIPPNTLHHLVTDTSPMAFFYVDAESDDLKRLHVQFPQSDGRLGLGFGNESGYLAALGRLHRGKPWKDAREDIGTALGLGPFATGDPRVEGALRTLRMDSGRSTQLAALARDASLSPSRFLHLFKQTTGVPFRRFRLWVRLGLAVRSIARGESLTEAALSAGFSSSAHFSAAYREMFGFSPSTLARARPAVAGSSGTQRDFASREPARKESPGAPNQS